jgi:hypothetical protein
VTRDAYAVLGVEPAASNDELRDAFRALAAELHPDRHQVTPVGTKDQVTARMAEVTDAWRQVSTPEKRHAYDLIRAREIEAPGEVPPTVRPAVVPRRRPAARPVVDRGRRLSEFVLRPVVVVAAGLVLALVAVIVAVVAANDDDDGSTLSEDDVVGRCVLPPEGGLVTFAPAGCANDTLLVLDRVFDQATCIDGTLAVGLADDPEFIVCVVGLDP